VTPYTFDATAAGVSDTVDMSSCDGGVSVTFDQSVEDGSTDAVVELRACATATSEWQSCVLLRNGPEQLPDGVAVSIGNFPTTKPYALLRFPVGPSSDTARVVLSCTEETTTTSGGSGTPDDDSVTDPKMGADDFGDWSCAGTAESCTLDAGVVSATEMSIVSGSDFSCIAGACLIGADKIALGTDTTGGYAASVSEGGPATTATALVANGANCSANTYPLGVDASGAAEGCATIASAGITDGTIVNADVNASAAVDATKLAYAGGDTVGAGTVEAAIDELSTEKADASDILTSSQVFRADAATSWTSGAVTASDGTLLDMSAINASGTSEGLKLPQATSCTSATAQGQTCWDTTHKMLFVGDGTTALPAGMEVLYFYYYNATSVTTTLFGSDDLLGIYASSTSTRNTSQALRYVESLYQLGATGAQAFVHKIQCNLAPIGSSTWTNGSDSVALQLVEMDAASATAMTTIGSPATLSGTVAVAPNPFLAGNVVSSTINAFTTLTGGAHYIGINPVLTDADNGVVGLAIQCSVWLKRTI